MIKENQAFLFLVTHIDVENQYLKIWAQTDEMGIRSVNEVLTRLQNKLEQCNVPSPNNVLPHTQCCTRTPHNNDFVRAKILQSRSDGMVQIQYVDYGNVAHVPIHNIRLLDNLPGAEYLFSIPYAATCFILADVMPIGGSWSPEVIKQIRSLLVNNSFQGIYREYNGCKILKLSLMNEDFGTTLVNRNMALSSSSCISTVQTMPVAPAQSLRTPHQVRNPVQENWRAQPPVPHTVQQALPQKVVKTNSFKAIQLEIGSVHDVQVSYVDEGPCKFSVQLLESIPYLDVMMKAINSRTHIALQESPIAGTVCLGQQTHPHRLCRVVLNSPGDASCKVYYADYGHHEVLAFSSLYQIPDEFVVPNIFSIRFTLNGISGWNVSQEMKDYFGGLVANKSLKLRVCKGPLSPLTQYCDLFLNQKCIREILSEVFPESCEVLYLEPKQLQIRAKETVVVPFVESPSKFFVQIESDEKLLDELMQKVEQASKTAPGLSHGQMRKEMPCIALYDDQKWYRASILKIIDDIKVSVFYVDYGNEEVVSLNNLRAIPSHLVQSLPKQAIKCSLNGFQFDSANSEITKKFESLVLEERMILVAIDHVNGSYIVDLHDARYISDPMADIAKNLRSVEPLHIQAPEQHQSENWTGNGNWNKEKGPGMIQQKANNFGTSDNSKSKFRKDNENEQRHDNRFRRENSDYQNGPAPGNRFTKDDRRFDRSDQNERHGKQNDVSRLPGHPGAPDQRFNGRSNERNNLVQSNSSSVNSRLDRSYGSDRDSDTSSKGGGRRNNRQGRQIEDQRNRGLPPNRNKIGGFENDQNSNDASRNGFSNYNPEHTTVPKVHAKKSPEHKSAPQISSQIPPPNITAGAMKNCIMVYYNNPTSFYVQLCPDNDQLSLIMDKIYSTYEKGGKIIPPSRIKEGLHCIAQWQEDQQWYRAVVKSVDNSTVTVHFSDYGNLETASFDKIKEIQPELCKLPAQAIHCELFCPKKSAWTKEETDQLAQAADDKTLEAEFIMANEHGVYKILLKDLKTTKYLNDMFANGIDLLKEKDMIRNKVKSTNYNSGTVTPTYAAFEQEWSEYKVDFGKTYSANITSFHNPDSFYFQLLNQQKEFRDMMNEIQVTYAKREPISIAPKVGFSVLAAYPEDGVLYRAKVVELKKGPVVQYVDYGDRAMVDLSKIYPVEKKFMVLPKQAVLCGLKNLAPISGSNWSNATEIGKVFAAEKFDCIFHELQNDKYLISMKANGVDVGNALVQKGLAVFSSVEKRETLTEVVEKTVETVEVPKLDFNLLEGQTLLAKVSNVEGVNKFHVQFQTASICQQNVDSYMTAQDPQVKMPVLLPHEVCLGAGCLFNSKGTWRRGVVVNLRKSLYDVILIDTGEHVKVTLKSMLKLPGQLSAMQNQAVECSLFGASLSPKADDMLKSLIDKKNVKIFVEKVERNRLVVRLFDMNGNKIKVIGDSQDKERISPIANMPILSSTHNVQVTHVKNSACLWLQRINDASIEKKLLDDMFEHYSMLKADVPKAVEKELFAGLWVDGNWYRVLVLELRDSDQVKVQLIDYGEEGIIPAADLRILDPKFYAPHQLAMKVSLTVTLSGSNDSQIDVLQPMVDGKQLSATFYNVNRKWIVELKDDGGDKLSDKLKALNVVEDTTIKPFEHPEVGEMVVGEKYEVMASHVDAPNLLWLQRKEEDEALYDLHDQMQQVAASCPDYEGIPEEKSLCLAIYSLDNCWYRAEVIDADADITTVRFIDYGNTDVIDNNRSAIKQLSDKWKSVRGYAIPCRLDVVSIEANGAEWSEEACSRIKELASPDNVLKALVISDKTPMRVDLFLDDKSICELLVAEGLAAYVKSSDELEENLLEAVEEEQFDPKSAFVSHVVSVDEFWVQEDAKVKDLEMVADRLVMASIFPPLEKVEQGLVCIAHYPEDNQYYRAIVLSHDDDKGTRVSYIDYGNSAMTQDMKVIPQDLAGIPPLSKKCCLVKPDGVDQWPDNVNLQFDKLAANGATVFILDVIAEQGEICLVRMTHNSKDVANQLLEMCTQPKSSHIDEAAVTAVPEAEDITTTERPAPIGEENTSSNMCKITCGQSPVNFWIQKKTDCQELEGVLKILSDAASLAPYEDSIEEGKLMAVKYAEDDAQCYRCKIINNTDAGAQVCLIDFGTCMTVQSNTLFRKLPENLMHIPALAVACTLKMPDKLEQWPDSACEKFNNLAADDLAEFKFEVSSDSDSENPLPVALYYKDQSVAELLLSGFAENLLKDNTETDCTRQEDVNDQNISNDSAVYSETEQHSNKETHVQEENGTNDLNVEREIPLAVAENEKADDLKPTALFGQEQTTDTDEFKTSADQEVKILDESKSLVDQEEKIVPGSISRGLSIEDIATDTNEFETSADQEVQILDELKSLVDQEEKIVPGSISRELSIEDIATDTDEFETSADQEVKILDESKSLVDQEEKIVPGSISRGLSIEDIARFSPVPPSSNPEDKIVPGSINKGNMLQTESESSQESQESPNTSIAERDIVEIEIEKISQVTDKLKTISFDERVVPSCISRGETPVEMDRPSTPKTAHSEKLVAGAVNAQNTLDFEDEDASISAVEVQVNIPEAAP